MTKKLKILFLIAVFIISCIYLTGCSDEPEHERGYLQYDNLDEYIQVSNYKGNTITQKYIDKMVLRELDYLYTNAALYQEVTDYDAKVTVGDVAVIDFVGYIDDTEFAGGSASNYSLQIGSGMFIDGFEDGIIGMTQNESKSLTLSFPDDYYPTEYAGVDVVFLVTLKKIYEPPELTDEICRRYTYQDSVDEFLTALKKTITSDYIWDIIFSQSVLLQTPDEYNEMYSSIIKGFTDTAATAKLTLEEYVSKYGEYNSEYGLYKGISLDNFYEAINSYCELSIKEDLVLYWILRKENITESSPIYAKMLEAFTKEHGYSDPSDLYSDYTQDQITVNIYYRCASEIIFQNTIII